MTDTFFVRRAGSRCLRGWRAAVAAFAFVGHLSAHADTIEPSVQRRLHEAVVEVVMGKPEADPLTYEKPLPLDLIPFVERNAKYRAVGTAFVIEEGRFVTAAHVLDAAAGSQFGPLAIRDSNGAVYLVDQVIRYSAAEDYAEFTVHNGPHVKPLETRAKPDLNEVVYAVGDALGEGIVIRDGLYTSDTPEERAGRWKWLRFSAAASPGNSGGPLIDRKGRVLGVVLRKSPNENLNVAVGIAQVLHGSVSTAQLESRFTYEFPPMQATLPATLDDHFALPLPIAEFYAAANAALDAALQRVHQQYFHEHGESVFPQGTASAQLLNELAVAPFPRAIVQRPDDTWTLTDPKPQKAQLDHNGVIEWAPHKGYVYLELRAPDDLPRSTLYSDSRQFMDLLLKGLQMHRPVGSDRVRITSLGSARHEAAHRDTYGRPWQMRAWRLPYNDSLILTLGLPTPKGYIIIAKECPTRLEAAMTRELLALADFTYVTFAGTLKQWREYLDQPLKPDLFQTLEIRADDGQAFHYRSKRVTIDIPTSVQSIDAASVLLLKFSYFLDGDRAVWDVGGLYLADTEQKGNWVDVLRRHRPPAGLPDSFNSLWHTLETHAHPFTGAPFATNGSERIESVANAKQVAAHAPIAYTVTLNEEGSHDQATMKRKLDAVVAGVTVLEH